MNINQSGSNGASKRPRYENNPVSPVIIQARQKVMSTIKSQQDKEKTLIEIIKGNDFFTSAQFDRLVQHKNTKVICKLIKHRGDSLQEHHFEELVQCKNTKVICKLIEYRGHDFKEHHVENLIERNDNDIEFDLLASKAVKMSETQKDTIIDRTMRRPLVDFIPY